jgi:hypothetical protein
MAEKKFECKNEFNPFLISKIFHVYIEWINIMCIFDYIWSVNYMNTKSPYEALKG